MKYISVDEVKYVAHTLAKELMSAHEPIPEFSTRFPNVLEQCLATSQQTFGGKDLYPTLVDKASMLFYVLIKNHPFQNGNKRVAVMTLLYFLRINGKWIRTDTISLYRFAKWVAESDSKLKDAVVNAIRDYIKGFLVVE